MRPTIVNALSIDVEEYYHATIYREATQHLEHQNLESRVELGIDRILSLLADRGIRGTFFVLGEVAAVHPSMVRRLAENGHEVACHGYHHELVCRQTPHQFRDDVHRAKILLEDVTGQAVHGYRAPSFSIGKGEDWALDILLEEGFHYDSSSYPILHDRYGRPSAPRFSYEIRRNGNRGLREFPIGTVRFLGMNFPIGGGGYFRLLPLALIRGGIRRVNARDEQPTVFYIHPWELDPGQPHPPMPWHHRVRHYVGIQRAESRLRELLRDVRFDTIQQVFGVLR
jgi:polysaccharide deacetylase family protein (PEP-CTERM system associated)